MYQKVDLCKTISTPLFYKTLVVTKVVANYYTVEALFAFNTFCIMFVIEGLFQTSYISIFVHVKLQSQLQKINILLLFYRDTLRALKLIC